MSNRVNLELRTLTMVAMLFMPASLIAGIFGMNFRIMPLLESANGFWFVMGMMAAIAVVMITIFARRRWIGKQGRRDRTG